MIVNINKNNISAKKLINYCLDLNKNFLLNMIVNINKNNILAKKLINYYLDIN